MSDYNIIIEQEPNNINISIDPDVDQTNINVDPSQAPVQSVNGKIGFVTITQEDLHLTGLATSESLNNYYLKSNPSGFATTGDISNYVTKVSGQFLNRPTVNGTGILLSGDSSINNVTYNELMNLKNSNNLLPGQSYKITDFRLMWWNQSKENLVVKSGAIEPIIVTAIGNNSIYTEAKSSIHQDDIIYYDANAISSNTWGILRKNTPIPNFKGWIYRRIDTKNNIDIGWDWRNITHPCKKVGIPSHVPTWNSIKNHGYIPRHIVVKHSGKLYYAYDTLVGLNTQIEPSEPISGTAFWSPLTAFYEEYTYFPSFANSPLFSDPDFDYGVDTFNGYLELNKIYGQWWLILLPSGQEIQQPTFTSNITGSGYQYLTGIKDIYIRNGFNTIFYHPPSEYGIDNDQKFSKISNVKINSCYLNLINNYFISNTIDNCAGNTIGNFCQNNNFSNLVRNNIQNLCQNNQGGFINKNTIGEYFTSNNIQYLSDNTVARDFTSNVALSMRSNIIGRSSYSNEIADDFAWNTIYDLFYFNIIKNGFSSNYITHNFQYNNINNNFNNNDIGDGFEFNSIKNNFSYNEISQNFKYNNIENNFSGNLCGEFFQNNTIENNISNLDFESSTYVYQPYSKTVFKDINGEISLRYFNENKQIVVVDATA